jgi:type IV pilus assembly protein PilC
MTLFSNADSSDAKPEASSVNRSRLPQPGSVANWLNQVHTQDLVTFSRNVATMVESGLPLAKIMNRQKTHASHPLLKRVAGELEKSLMEGMNFADALATHPDCFDLLYINMVRAGEQSGRLDYALYRLADLLERSQIVQGKIKPLLTYPLFVVGVILVDLFIFLGVILPLLLGQAKAALGELTGLLWGIDLLLSFWWVPLILLAVGLTGLVQFFKTETGKSIWNEAILYVPFVSNAVQSIQAYYFSLGVLMGYSGGLTLSYAAGLGVDAMTNLSVKEAFSGLEDEIEAGKTLTGALSDIGYLPGPVMDMIATGEDAGELEKMLYNVLKHLEVQIDAQIETMMSLLRPLLIVTAAMILGSGLLIVYMGLFSFLGGVFQQAMSRIPTVNQ